MLVAGDELALELLKLDPLDDWLRKPPLDDDDDDDEVDEDDVPEVVVAWVVLAVVWVVVSRWLPMETPKALKPSIATTAAPRFMRPAMRCASAFERRCAGGDAGLAGRSRSTIGVRGASNVGRSLSG